MWYYVFLIIGISLQLRVYRQIAEPRKYCLVRVIVFLWHVFFSIFVSHGLGIRLNALQALWEGKERKSSKLIEVKSVKLPK